MSLFVVFFCFFPILLLFFFPAAHTPPPVLAASVSAISTWARIALYLASCESRHPLMKQRPNAAYKKPMTRRTMAANRMKLPGWVGRRVRESLAG